MTFKILNNLCRRQRKGVLKIIMRFWDLFLEIETFVCVILIVIGSSCSDKNTDKIPDNKRNDVLSTSGQSAVMTGTVTEQKKVYPAATVDSGEKPSANAQEMVYANISKEEIIRIAKSAIEGVADVPKEAPIKIEVKNQKIIVTFETQLAEGVRGADYHAKIEIDLTTKKVISILVGS